VTFVGGAVTFMGGAYADGACAGGAVTFVGGAATFVGEAVTFVERAVAFIGGAVTFAEGAVTFAEGAVTFAEGAVTFIGRAVTFVGRAVTFIGGAVTFIGRAVTFIGKGSLAIGRLFKTAEAGVADDIRINGRNLRRRLIIYKLKGPLVLINSLISTSDHSIRSSSWATLYSTCGIDLLLLLKTHTPLRWSSCLSPLVLDLSASLNVYTVKLLKSSWYNSHKLLSLKLYLVYLLILNLM